jgi:hypothetical protein
MGANKHFGFTGTQDGMNDAQKLALKDYLTREAKPGDFFHHGDCVGADEEAAEIARNLGMKIISHPPINRSKRAYVRCSQERESKQYLDRNHDIVDESEVLLAAPKTDDEVLRSGTLATIRYARKTEKNIVILYPNNY